LRQVPRLYEYTSFQLKLSQLSNDVCVGLLALVMRFAGETISLNVDYEGVAFGIFSLHELLELLLGVSFDAQVV